MAVHVPTLLSCHAGFRCVLGDGYLTSALVYVFFSLFFFELSQDTTGISFVSFSLAFFALVAVAAAIVTVPPVRGKEHTYLSADCFSGKHLRQEQNIHPPSFLPRRVGLGSRIIQCRIHRVAWMAHMTARIQTYTYIYLDSPNFYLFKYAKFLKIN